MSSYKKQEQTQQRCQDTFLQNCYDVLLKPKIKLLPEEKKSQKRKRIYQELNVKIEKVVYKCHNKTVLPQNLSNPKHENIKDDFTFPEDLQFDFDQGVLGKKAINDDQLVPCMIETGLESGHRSMYYHKIDNKRKESQPKDQKYSNVANQRNLKHMTGKNDRDPTTVTNRKQAISLQCDNKTKNEDSRYRSSEGVTSVRDRSVPETPFYALLTDTEDTESTHYR